MQLWFGPNLRYFFNDRRGNVRYRAPQGFIDLFAREQIKTVVSDASCVKRFLGLLRDTFWTDSGASASSKQIR